DTIREGQRSGVHKGARGEVHVVENIDGGVAGKGNSIRKRLRKPALYNSATGPNGAGSVCSAARWRLDGAKTVERHGRAGVSKRDVDVRSADRPLLEIKLPTGIDRHARSLGHAAGSVKAKPTL